MLVDTYIGMCATSKTPVTLTGLILSLGLTSKEGFYKYAEYDGFSDSVKRARLFIENAYETRLVVGTNAAAPIFALKNFGWADKHPSELDNLQAEKLRRELATGEDGQEEMPESITIKIIDASRS